VSAPTSNPQHRPRPDPRPRPPAAAPARLKWGWIEWFVLSQTFLPALMFVPGLSPIRSMMRISCYLIGALAWAVVANRGKASPASTTFPARSWLTFSSIWLLVSMAHPNIYSLPAAAGQVAMYLSILSPAYWAGEELKAPRRLGRLMALLFLCNALSATVGLAQVFSDRFNPPVIPMETMAFQGEGNKIEVDGRKIFRPCGLSDSPGAAAPAGATAALIGLCFALRPIGAFKRLACAGLAFIGFAVIYYTQVRAIMVVLVICLAAMTVLLFLRGRVGSALTLAGGGGLMLFGSLFWVARRMGSVMDRFGSLVTSDQGALYYSSRGGFVWEALTQTIWEYPLGRGLGWWGMINMLFFIPGRISMIWVEVMIPAWVVDGGFPLLIGYVGAVMVAVFNTMRVALKSKDRDLAFWASVVLAQDISTVALCFSYVAFLSPIGLQFWLLNAAVHAADVQTRGAAEGVTAEKARPRPRAPGRAAT